MKLTSRNGRLSCIGCLLALPWLFMLVLLAGCPAGGGNGNGNENGNGNSNGNENGNTSPGGRGEIITPASSFGLSLLDPPFQVRYSVPDDATDIRGYRFAVADSSPNSPAIGDEVTIAANLQAGSNRFFDFDPSEAGVGYHRVGVSFIFDGESDFAEGSGVIHVEGSPDPIFIQPAQALTVVEEGAVVTVSFDARDPEDQVQWRLFYYPCDGCPGFPNAPPDSIGTQLAIGEGNVGTVSFRTEGLAEGNYDLGLSATDSGMSVAATVDAGQLDRIVTIPNSSQNAPRVRVVAEGSIVAPTITVTNPGTADVPLFKDETFAIQFAASVPQVGAIGSIEVFYDTDTNVNNGFTIIAEDLPVSATQTQFPTGVVEGTYFIGATVRDGVNAPVTDYSAGRVVLTRTITLAVTEPNTTIAVAPGSPIAIRWTTNAPATSGTVDVFAKRLNSSNQPIDPKILITTAGAMTLRTATFTSAASGLFQITVQLNITGGTPISGNSPRPVRVSSLPSVAWLGSIAEATPRLDGAIFGGVNFEDNAGSAFTKADDLDDDGLNEFVIAARYGKPFFVNPNGIGVGEAYVIYGERGTKRLKGTYNLNSVGSTSLRGVTLSGIRTIDNSGITEGLSDVLSIPDADGDEKDELAFGFPKVQSRNFSHARLADLDRPNQFLGGGIVIVSSENSNLIDPTGGSSVINLDLVGQQFTNTSITPLDRNLAIRDRAKFKPGTPADPDNGEEEIPDSCELGTDSVVESVVGPNVGFVDFDYIPCIGEEVISCQPTRVTSRIGLAPAQAWGLYLDGNPSTFNYFVPLGSPPAPDLRVCPTLTDVILQNACTDLGVFSGINAGSGFYPSTSIPLEPLGARIVGRDVNDRFGTTLTLNSATGSEASAELIVSAPKRSASCVSFEEFCECEVEGVDCEEILPDTGLAYVTMNRNFWGVDSVVPGVPPKPHQYIMNRASHCSAGTDLRAAPIWFNPNIGPTPGGNNDPAAGALKIAGDVGDEIQNLLGIDDVNGDGRPDLAIGAPSAIYEPTNIANAGRVYVAYRRQSGSLGLEGDIVLSKLKLAPTNAELADGLLISATTPDGLGSSLAGGFDFNGDEISDLVIGSPNAGTGTGEVIILFGGTDLSSPEGGITVPTLLNQTRTVTGGPVAVRIKGSVVGDCTGTPAKACLADADCGTGRTCVIEKGLFGFNVSNAGDVDGDGLDDLLIAAPNATPRFDADLNDGVDQLSTPGVDINLDGIRDEVPGDDQLLQSGLVYVILGKNRLDQVRTCQGTTKLCTTAVDCAAGVACTLTDPTINIDQLGTSRLKGLMFAGRRAGDRLGGGDASDPDLGGGFDTEKVSGRGEGLGAAGDVDGDGRDDLLLSALIADPRRDPNTGTGVRNGGEVYLIYGSNVP